MYLNPQKEMKILQMFHNPTVPYLDSHQNRSVVTLYSIVNWLEVFYFRCYFPQYLCDGMLCFFKSE
jgi:hypothetical protein